MTKVLGVDVGRVGDLGGAVGDLGGFLREQRESAQMSLRQLAAAAGVSNPYLSQVERGLRRPSAEVLQQIARGLRISAEALYVRAGILDERPGNGGEVRAAVLADPYLSERQREVVLEIYATFRAENARSEVPPTAPSPAAGEPTDGAETTDGPEPAADRAGETGAEPRPSRRRGPRRSAAPPAAVQEPDAQQPDAQQPAGGPATPAPTRRRARRTTSSFPSAPEGGPAGTGTGGAGASGVDAAEDAPARAPEQRSPRRRRPTPAPTGEGASAGPSATPRDVAEDAAVVVPAEPSSAEVAAERTGATPPAPTPEEPST